MSVKKNSDQSKTRKAEAYGSCSFSADEPLVLLDTI